MAPSSMQAEVVIQLVNGTAIVVRNIQRGEIIGLQYNSNSSNVSTSVCLSISDISLLSITKVLVECCQLLIERRVTATITELSASNSVFHLSSSQVNQTIFIRSSEFHFSTLNISANHANQIYAMTSALRIDSSSLTISLVTIKLQTQADYKLSILNSSILGKDSGSVETGIKVETVNTAKL